VQPTHVELDLRDGSLTVGVNGEVGSGDRAQPAAVYLGQVRRWGLPCAPTAGSANWLLAELEPLAQRMLAGAVIELDRRSVEAQYWGVLDTDDAQQAEEQALALIEQAAATGELEPVHELSPADVWIDGPPREVTADTTDAELEAIADREAAELVDCTEGAHTVLVGALDYLRAHREQLRMQLREELVEIAAKIGRRDDLIRRIASWRAGDTSRSLAELTGLSHVGIQKIIKRQEG
jgi:hypothetical protein